MTNFITGLIGIAGVCTFLGIMLWWIKAVPLIIIGVLVLVTQVVFPKYFDELRAAHESMLRTKGISETEIAEALKAAAAMENPYLQAMFGAIGTIVTGVVVSLIASAIVKKRA